MANDRIPESVRMTRLEKQTLNFFCFLEILLGVWMISSPLSNENVIRIFEIYSPMWILGIIYIIGGSFNLWKREKYFWFYVLLVSVPLVFFGLVYLQVSLTLFAFTSNVIIFNAVGLYSAIYAGQSFSKERGEKIHIYEPGQE